MRNIALLLGILAALGMTLAYPYVGVLLWSWFALQQPHQEAYGFVQTAPLNLIIAVVTLAAWLLSRERKIPPTGFIFWMLVIFFVWMTFNSFFAFDPAQSWPYWDRTWKTLLLGVVIAATTTSRTRIYALVWIIVISLFYYGVKGGTVHYRDRRALSCQRTAGHRLATIISSPLAIAHDVAVCELSARPGR